MVKSKKKKRNQGDVELNLAAMLDMAFQLLTFFILTFKPAPIEGDVMLRMPLPMPTTILKNAERLGSDDKNTNPVQGLESLVITVIADDAGGIKNIAVADAVVDNVQDFGGRLQSILGDKGTAFEQVLIQVGSNVSYGELMQVIDVCTRQRMANGEKLSKLSFIQLPGG
jgi:biopolymer transport protein ExbD